MTDRVMVFIDYQNVHLTAAALFLPEDAPRHHAHLNPAALGHLLVSRPRFGGELAGVHVYRAAPSRTTSPKPPRPTTAKPRRGTATSWSPRTAAR